MNTKQTSEGLAQLAARTLNDDNSSKIAKRLAGSALSQTHTGNQTSAEMEGLASSVLRSTKYSDDTKSLAGSILSQSNKQRQRFMLKHPYFYVMIVLLVVVSLAWGNKLGLGKQYDCGHGQVITFNAITGRTYLTYQYIQYVGSFSSGDIAWDTEPNTDMIKLPKTLTFDTDNPEILLSGGFAGSYTLCKPLN